MLRNETSQNQYAALTHTDITDEEAFALINGRQQLDAILAVMVKAKLFSGSPAENLRLFMSLIDGTKDMNYAGKPITPADPSDIPEWDDEFSNDLDELVSIYQMLGGQILTLNMHHALLTCASTSLTKKILGKLISLAPLKQSTVDMYFSAPGDWMSLNCWTEIENPTGEWLLYALDHIKNAKDIPALVSELRVPDGGEISFGGEYLERNLWLTFDTFKVMVQHAERCKDVMPVFLDFCAKMPKEPMQAEGYLADRLNCAFTLKKYGISLNEHMLSLAFELPVAGQALSLCRDTEFIQQNISKENMLEYHALLTHKELIRAVAALAEIQEKFVADNRAIDNAALKKDIKSLFAAFKNEKLTIQGMAQRLMGTKPMSLNDQLLELQRKYHVDNNIVNRPGI
jgi:hypothetical protein